MFTTSQCDNVYKIFMSKSFVCTVVRFEVFMFSTDANLDYQRSFVEVFYVHSHQLLAHIIVMFHLELTC